MAILIFILLIVASVCIHDFVDGRNWQSATSDSRNSVIFENRNKKYGAYNLRRDYNDHFGIILLIFTLSFLVIAIVNVTLRTAPARMQLPIMDTIAMNIGAPPVEIPPRLTGSGGGAGSPSNDPVIHRPMEQTQKVATQLHSDQSVFSGQSNKTNGINVTNKASSMIKSDDPFGAGGSTKGIKSAIFGVDNGIHEYKDHYRQGSEPATKRKKLTNLNADDIESNIDCIVHLKVYINAEGNVIRTENDTQKTTTNDVAFLAKISELVKRQVKYDKREGANVQMQTLSIQIHAR